MWPQRDFHHNPQLESAVNNIWWNVPQTILTIRRKKERCTQANDTLRLSHHPETRVSIIDKRAIFVLEDRLFLKNKSIAQIEACAVRRDTDTESSRPIYRKTMGVSLVPNIWCRGAPCTSLAMIIISLPIDNTFLPHKAVFGSNGNAIWQRRHLLPPAAHLPTLK